MLADQAMSSLHRQMKYSLHSEMKSSLQMCFVAKHQFAPYPSIILPHIKASNMLSTYFSTYSTIYSTYFVEIQDHMKHYDI